MKLVGKTIEMNGEKCQVLQFLDEGVFGKVYGVTGSKNKMALKVLHSNIPQAEGLWKEEVEFLSIVNNNNHISNHFIVKIIGYGEMRDSSKLSFMKRYIIMERLGNSILQTMTLASKKASGSKYVAFSNRNIKAISSQIAHAFSYLHKNGILHLDLKPENILFFNCINNINIIKNIKNVSIFEVADTSIRVIDFGSAETFDKNIMKSETTMRVQTQNYRAPEVFLGLPYGDKCEVWSFGCLLSELYSGELLFFGSDDEFGEAMQLDVIQSVLRSAIPHYMFKQAFDLGSAKVRRNENSTIGFHLKSSTPVNVKPLFENMRCYNEDDISLFQLIFKTLHIDPEDRPTFSQIMNDKFFRLEL